MMRILSDRGLRNPNPSHAMVAVEDRGLRSGNATPMVFAIVDVYDSGRYIHGRQGVFLFHRSTIINYHRLSFRRSFNIISFVKVYTTDPDALHTRYNSHMKIDNLYPDQSYKSIRARLLPSGCT